MNGMELNEDLPESFFKEAEKMGVEERELRGNSRTPPHSLNEENRGEIERVVGYVKKTIFPKVKR
jgi:hypothetical protein